MSQSYKGLTIPAYSDAADGPKAFKDFVDSGAVPRFANTAARTAAITSPSVGMLVYMIDVSEFALYNGASWVTPFLKNSGGTMSGAIDMNNAKITTLGTPTAAGDATTKAYVDSATTSHTHATGAHVHSGAEVTTGTLDVARIPSLDASKINAGIFTAARIPVLDASKITTGTFADAQIPGLAGSKIISGTVAIARLPTGTGSANVAIGNHDHTRLIPHAGSQAQITVSTGAPSGGSNGDIHLRV